MLRLNNMKVAAAVLHLKSELATEQGSHGEALYLEYLSGIAEHLTVQPALFRDATIKRIGETLMRAAELEELADEVEPGEDQ